MEGIPNNNFNNGFKEDADKGGKFSGGQAYEGEDTLESKVEEIKFTNLTELNLATINELRDIASANMENMDIREYMAAIRKYADKLTEIYGIETLMSCALYHLLIGSTIPEDVPRLDLLDEDGDGQIETFIRNGFKETL